jgi:hypothetical protein
LSFVGLDSEFNGPIDQIHLFAFVHSTFSFPLTLIPIFDSLLDNFALSFSKQRIT